MSSRTAYAALIALSVAFAAVPATGFAAAPGDVVATVNGKEIKRSDVLALQQSMPQLRQVPLEMVYDQILEHLINSQLLVAEARKEKLQDDPVVKERLQAMEAQVLQQALLQKRVEGRLTDDLLQKRYDELVKKAPSKEEVHARHILLTSEEEAKSAIAEIQGGKSFEEVAKNKSTGPSAENGGDLGYFGKDEMVPEFAEAAFAMKPGEVSKQPVKTQFGWHVIKVEDKRTAKPPAFDEVKEELKEQVGDEMIMQVVQDLRAKADVKIITPEPAPAPGGANAAPPAGKGKGAQDPPHTPGDDPPPPAAADRRRAAGVACLRHPLPRTHRPDAGRTGAGNRGGRRLHQVADRLGPGSVVPPGAGGRGQGARGGRQFRQRQRLHRLDGRRLGAAHRRGGGQAGRLRPGGGVRRLDRHDRRAAR